MPRATNPIHNRLAIIFDFDETLAPDSFSALLDHCGYDPDAFEEEKVRPLLEDGWDKKLARFYALMQESRQRDNLTITADTFTEVGRNLELYPEVDQLFERVREYTHAITPEVEVEFYLLTAGMLEIPRATAIADEFHTMWGSTLHFDEESGELSYVKQIVSYPDKIRFLLKLCKGMNLEQHQIKEDVYKEIPAEDWYVPFSQVVYVGDGDSDMPIFSYLDEHEGLAIGVFQSESVSGWEGYEDIHGEQRVQNLAPSDYREDSELMKSLKLAVESICKQIALRQKSEGE